MNSKKKNTMAALVTVFVGALVGITATIFSKKSNRKKAEKILNKASKKTAKSNSTKKV